MPGGGDSVLNPPSVPLSTSNVPARSPKHTTPHQARPSLTAPSSPPYSVFSIRQKRVLALLLGLTSLASPLTASIYFPLIPLLSTQFHTSIQAINLSVTIYVVFQALSPALFATLSDSFGRRAILLATFTIYVLANLGLALNRNVYSVLLILRALQSLGASAVVSIAYGVVADVSVPAERGKLLGPLMAATNLGPCIGPVVGGWVALGTSSCSWVFWCLVIYGGITVMTLGLVFPETARNLVGNGSLRPTGLRRPWWNSIEDWIRSRSKIAAVAGRSTPGYEEKPRDPFPEVELNGRFKISNFTACIRIIFWKDSALVLWMTASFYSVWYCIQTSIPTVYQNVYGFNEFENGLSFLTGGAGVILGALATGKLMDRNYKKTAEEVGLTVDKISGDDMNRFPIEKARSRGSWYLLAVSTCALVGYGWAITTHAHPSIPLILQCIIGFLCTVFNQMYSALLVDIFPDKPSTAAASGNIARCTLSAMMVASLQLLINTLGRGWFFILLGAVNSVAGAIVVFLVQTQGRRWRGQRVSGSTESSIRDDDDETCRVAQDSRSRGQDEKVCVSNAGPEHSLEIQEEKRK